MNESELTIQRALVYEELIRTQGWHLIMRFLEDKAESALSDLKSGAVDSDEQLRVKAIRWRELDDLIAEIRGEVEQTIADSKALLSDGEEND